MLVIFDCDGVLLDSEAIFCSVDAEALTALGFPTSAASISERFAGIPHRQAWQELAGEHGLVLPEDWVEQILSECDRRMATDLQVIAGAADAIAALRRKGHAIAVASSTELALLRRNLDHAGFLGHLDPHVYSTSQVKRSKPAPDVFLFVASQMGFDPCDCVVVEDSVAGVTAGRRAGMKTIGFVGGGHVYEALSSRLSKAEASHICVSMDEIAELVLQGDSAYGVA